MSVKKLSIDLLATASAIALVFATSCLASVAFNSQKKKSHALSPDVYRQVLNRIMPIGEVKDSESPRDSKWLVTVRILPSFSQKEVFLSLRSSYKGGAEGSLVSPAGQSIYDQCVALQEKNPGASIEEYARQIAVNQKKISKEDLPQINDLIVRFEAIVMSPVLPDELSVDSTRYEFRSQSPYGQSMSVTLAGPGPTSEKQPHPLLQWIEDYRKTLQSYQESPTAVLSKQPLRKMRKSYIRSGWQGSAL